MPDKSSPVSEADRQARAVFMHEAQRRGGYGRIADAFGLSPATCRAIFRGERDVPPGLARQMADDLRKNGKLERNAATLADYALQLDLWADECDARRKEQARG